MKKKKNEVTIRSSAAEYLTYVASVGDQQDSIEMRYEDENIWLTQKMMAERENFNKPKSGYAKQPQCPVEKQAAIMEALKYFNII